MQETPSDILQQLAQHIEQRAVEAPGHMEGEFAQAIAVEVGGRSALVSMSQVSEVMEVPQTTRVPGVKSWIIGVANVRGNIVPLINLGAFFNLKTDNRPSRPAVIVIERPDTRLGLLVDRVIGMRKIDESALAPAGSDSAFPGCVAGLAELESENIPLIDLDRLLGNEKFNQVNAA